MYLAKTLYQIPADHPFVPGNLPASYFACHLPLYPLLIRALTLFTLGNYPFAMLLTTLLCSAMAAFLFYLLLRKLNVVASPVWTTVLFCVLPPRWLIYHSVGATEPLFLCLVFAMLLAFLANKSWLVVISIFLASLTRITGVLLIPVGMILYLRNRQWKAAALVAVGSLGILAYLGFCYLVFGDALAYFNWNMGKKHLMSSSLFPVFHSFSKHPLFMATEYYLGIYVLYGIGTLALFKNRPLFVYCSVFYVFLLFVAHEDLSRYFLSIAPFALLVGFDAILSNKVCRLILPMYLYLTFYYAYTCLPYNLVQPKIYERLLHVLQGSP